MPDAEEEGAERALICIRTLALPTLALVIDTGEGRQCQRNC